jgi:WhiB family redox-sensing transcriptional regulator
MQDAATKSRKTCMKKNNLKDPRNYEEPKCASIDSDLFYGKDPDEPGYSKFQIERQYDLAKKICSGCIHKIECAEWGIQNEDHGLWGGLTPNERRKLRRRRESKAKDTALV